MSIFACNKNSFRDFSWSVDACIVIEDVFIQINVSGNPSIHVHPCQPEKSSKGFQIGNGLKTVESENWSKKVWSYKQVLGLKSIAHGLKIVSSQILSKLSSGINTFLDCRGSKMVILDWWC